MRRGQPRGSAPRSSFARFRFPPEVITVAVGRLLTAHPRTPASISAWRTHVRTVATVATPNFAATDVIAAHFES
jgi:hypothetical protein